LQAADGAVGRSKDLSEARRPAAHRAHKINNALARDCWPGGWARSASSPRPARAAWRGYGYGLRAAGLGMRGLHGRCGHGAAGVERASYAPSWRRSPRSFVGSKTLKDAISEAMRDWVTNVRTTYYLLGSALGPHPYPTMVRDFHRCISREMKEQILEKEGRLRRPSSPAWAADRTLLAHSTSSFRHPGPADRVEAGGRGTALGDHAVRFRAERRGFAGNIFLCLAG